MFDKKYLEELAKNLYNTLPTSFRNLESDIQEKFKEILQSAFTRLDLVTREEFDIQVKVLERTREKLDQLQHQVQDLTKKDHGTH